jgi:NHL repeat-containing protein
MSADRFRPSRILFIAVFASLFLAAPAQASSGSWDRTWGRNVDNVAVGTGFEICTVAANCKAADASTGLGGEISDLWSVATDAAGNVYVADSGNNRIEKFDSAGNWLRAWGKNVNGGGVFGICTVAASCQAGGFGGLGGEFNQPQGVTVDASGNVYVADRNNGRIQKFDSSGNWLRTWGKNVDNVVAGTGFEICTIAANCKAADASTGGLGGELTVPIGIATDAANNVYVADLGNDRIQKFNASGTWDRTWGKNVDNVVAGTGFEICTIAANCKAADASTGLGGELSGAIAVAADAAGNLYVADGDNARIQKFDSSGNWLRAWGKDVDSVAAGTGFEICTIAANCKAAPVSTGLGGEFALGGLAGIATDAAGNSYVDESHRIQKFDSSGNWLRAWGKNVNGGGVFGICTVAASCQAGAQGALGGELSGPRGIATDAAGSVYVADELNKRIQKFADPIPPPPPSGGGGGSTPAATPLAGPTGQRAAALKKCKKKHGAARQKCKKKANLLPV